MEQYLGAFIYEFVYMSLTCPLTYPDIFHCKKPQDSKNDFNRYIYLFVAWNKSEEKDISNV